MVVFSVLIQFIYLDTDTEDEELRPGSALVASAAPALLGSLSASDSAATAGSAAVTSSPPEHTNNTAHCICTL